MQAQGGVLALHPHEPEPRLGQVGCHMAKGESPSERSGRSAGVGRPRNEGEGERDPRALSDVKFLTVSEVASLMRVSKMTVYRLVHSGELPAIRVGRSFRVPEWAVHEYLRDSYIEAG